MKKNFDKTELRKPSRRLIQTLAGNIRMFRKTKNISQEKLAEMCNLHRTYIGSVERGERNVTLSTLESIAGPLGVTVPKLLTKESNRHVKNK